MNTTISERLSHLTIGSKIIVTKIIIPKAVNVRYILRSDESISILGSCFTASIKSLYCTSLG